MEPKFGPGMFLISRYNYNYKTEKCEEFYWGGEEPNTNNFETLQGCQQMCPEASCDLPKDAGTCDENISRWYFDQVTSKCESFTWSGCGGNKNNFETIEKCKKYCREEPCLQLMKIGKCQQFQVRYYFNWITDECEPFRYSGCDENGNNFKTVKTCEDTCPAKRRQCQQEKKIGTCQYELERSYYHSQTKSCESFTWSGCQENANNFKTEADCRQVCVTE